MLDAERFTACKEKHIRLRRIARDVLEEEALRTFQLKIVAKPVEDEEFEAIRSQWDPLVRRVRFPWESICKVLAQSHPRRFDLSLWHEKQLCGLAVARLSDNKVWLSITHIEGSPAKNHALKGLVVPLVLVGSQIYATFVQREDLKGRLPDLRIMNPLKESIEWYAQCGYSELKRGNGYTYVTRITGEKL